MNKHLRLFQTHAQYTSYINGEDVYLPNVSYCNNENEIHYNPIDFSKQYLTFIPTEDSTFTFTRNALQYSLDDGATWTTLAANTASPTVTANSKILWKQTGLTPTSSAGIGTFSSTGNFNVQGNVMSLCHGDNFVGETDLTGKNYAFNGLFKGCSTLVGTKDLSLPATTLAQYCYSNMFYGCTSLTSAPVLPATTLAQYCYGSMFSYCTALVTVPELPATTLANGCYDHMFSYCTALVTVPELPATTLAFACYQYMFYGCTSLTSAPVLPATTLANGCYAYMFNGCSKLNYIKALFTTTPSTTYTQYWVTRVAASGTFVKNSAAQWNVTGTSGVPSGWSVQTASV